MIPRPLKIFSSQYKINELIRLSISSLDKDGILSHSDLHNVLFYAEDPNLGPKGKPHVIPVPLSHPIKVPFGLIGEELIVKVTHVFPTHTQAEIVSVLTPSPLRTPPLCRYFGECSGCQLQHVAYEAQVRMKERVVRDLFGFLVEEELGGEPEEIFGEMVRSPELYGYRTKITPHFQVYRRSRALSPIGFRSYAGNNLDIEECVIATPGINTALKGLRQKVLQNPEGFERGVSLILRESLERGGVVVKTDHKDTCTETVDGVRFDFPAGSFFQINRSILPLITRHVSSELRASPEIKHLIDCYCGCGLFLLTGARHFESSHGIEVSTASVRQVEREIAQNQLKNVSVFRGDSATIFSRLPKDLDPMACGMVLDPSRAGCSQEFLELLLDFGPRRVVYVACEPASQARDVAHLVRSGKYRVVKVVPFDFFPQTKHVENVVTLEKVVQM